MEILKINGPNMEPWGYTWCNGQPNQLWRSLLSIWKIWWNKRQYPHSKFTQKNRMFYAVERLRQIAADCTNAPRLVKSIQHFLDNIVNGIGRGADFPKAVLKIRQKVFTIEIAPNSRQNYDLKHFWEYRKRRDRPIFITSNSRSLGISPMIEKLRILIRLLQLSMSTVN